MAKFKYDVMTVGEVTAVNTLSIGIRDVQGYSSFRTAEVPYTTTYIVIGDSSWSMEMGNVTIVNNNIIITRVNIIERYGDISKDISRLVVYQMTPLKDVVRRHPVTGEFLIDSEKIKASVNRFGLVKVNNNASITSGSGDVAKHHQVFKFATEKANEAFTKAINHVATTIADSLKTGKSLVDSITSQVAIINSKVTTATTSATSSATASATSATSARASATSATKAQGHEAKAKEEVGKASTHARQAVAQANQAKTHKDSALTNARTAATKLDEVNATATRVTKISDMARESLRSMFEWIPLLKETTPLTYTGLQGDFCFRKRPNDYITTLDDITRLLKLYVDDPNIPKGKIGDLVMIEFGNDFAVYKLATDITLENTAEHVRYLSVNFASPVVSYYIEDVDKAYQINAPVTEARFGRLYAEKAREFATLTLEHKDASSTSATSSATSATASANSATASANSATASSTSATSSATSSRASATSATASSTSARASATSATSASNAATLSTRSADESEVHKLAAQKAFECDTFPIGIDLKAVPAGLYYLPASRLRTDIRATLGRSHSSFVVLTIRNDASKFQYIFPANPTSITTKIATRADTGTRDADFTGSFNYRPVYGEKGDRGDINGVELSGFNTRVGTYSLNSVTSRGVSNSAFGYSSLRKDIDGFNNSAFGYQSLEENLTGSYNSAFGSQALIKNTGHNNSAFGGAALSHNISGNNNSSFGYLSLKYSTGDNNSAFGYLSLRDSSTGDNNSSFGSFALPRNTTGRDNVSVGVGSLFQNTTGRENVSVGSSSHRVNLTGNNNAILGYRAGSNLVSGNGNVMIGANLAAPTSATSNYININNIIHGDRSDLIVEGFDENSDARLKENVIDISLDESHKCIGKLRPVKFNRVEVASPIFEKDKDGNPIYPDPMPSHGQRGSDRIELGLIAQEVEKVCPEVVSTSKFKERYKAIKYTRIIALLIGDNQYLHKKIGKLEEEIELLKS